MRKKQFLALSMLTLAGSFYLSAAPSEAQEFGNYRSECTGREIVVWGSSGDFRVYRGDDRRGVDVRTSSEIVWFCDGNRRGFFCQNSDRTNHVEVSWRRSGEVTFNCMRR